LRAYAELAGEIVGAREKGFMFGAFEVGVCGRQCRTILDLIRALGLSVR
jgi:hypothetical protein